MQIEGNITSDKQKIVNEFNEYFTNIGPNLAKLIPNLANKTVNDFLPQRNWKSIFMAPTELHEVKQIIKQLENNTGPGPDEIPVLALKLASSFIAPILVHLINNSLDQGEYSQID